MGHVLVRSLRADPLSRDELRELGVFWLDELGPGRRGKPGASNAFVTRLHVRYDGEQFPEDLVFQETANRENFQGLFVLRHAFTGAMACGAPRTPIAQVFANDTSARPAPWPRSPEGTSTTSATRCRSVEAPPSNPVPGGSDSGSSELRGRESPSSSDVD